MPVLVACSGTASWVWALWAEDSPCSRSSHSTLLGPGTSLIAGAGACDYRKPSLTALMAETGMFNHTLASMQDASYYAVDEMPGRRCFLIGCITHPLHVIRLSNPAPSALNAPLTGVREHHIHPHHAFTVAGSTMASLTT